MLLVLECLVLSKDLDTISNWQNAVVPKHTTLFYSKIVNF